MWLSQFSFASIMTPKNLMLYTLSIELLQILISKSCDTFLFPNIMNFVLLTFSDNLFSLNQLFTFSNSKLTVSFNCFSEK